MRVVLQLAPAVTELIQASSSTLVHTAAGGAQQGTMITMHGITIWATITVMSSGIIIPGKTGFPFAVLWTPPNLCEMKNSIRK